MNKIWHEKRNIATDKVQWIIRSYMLTSWKSLGSGYMTGYKQPNNINSRRYRKFTQTCNKQ